MPGMRGINHFPAAHPEGYSMVHPAAEGPEGESSRVHIFQKRRRPLFPQGSVLLRRPPWARRCDRDGGHIDGQRGHETAHSIGHDADADLFGGVLEAVRDVDGVIAYSDLGDFLPALSLRVGLRDRLVT